MDDRIIVQLDDDERLTIRAMDFSGDGTRWCVSVGVDYLRRDPRGDVWWPDHDAGVVVPFDKLDAVVKAMLAARGGGGGAKP